MTTGHKPTLKGVTIDKRGKITKVATGDVSKRIRQRKSKKVRPVRRTA